MKKMSAVLFIFFVAGCVDLGKVGLHPELNVVYINGQPSEVADCLYSAAISQGLYLARDDRLSDGTARYTLQDSQYESVANVELSRFSQDQTSVYFYRAKEAATGSAIAKMTEQCKNAG